MPRRKRNVTPIGIPATGYTLKFEDTFDTLTSNWGTNWLGAAGTITKPVNSSEVCAYDPARVTANGDLHLSCIQSSVVATDGNTYSYRSGLVNTYNKKEFTFGIFEARIYTDGNNWPAFWLNGHHNTWPDHIESDIMENLSSGPTPHFHSVSQPNVGFSHSAVSQPGWHVYAEKWTQGHREYWYDGVKVGEVDYTDTDYPQYIVLNLGMSDTHGGPVVAPSSMRVDYVRVWQ